MSSLILRCAAIAAALMATVPASAIAPSTAPRTLPFSEAVRAGDTLYLSGQIGIAPGGNLVAGGISAEARQAMDNIGRVLKTYGLGYGDVVHCLVMLADMRRWAEFNDVYVGYFSPGRLPARSAIGASGLALGAAVEVECTARFPTTIRTVDNGKSLGPYSQATIAGGFVFVSGLIAYDHNSNRMAAPDMATQMALIRANLDAVLASVGANRADIVKTRVYLRNPADMSAMNSAYVRWFADQPPPARTTVPGADWGRPDILVEIEAVALLPEGARR